MHYALVLGLVAVVALAQPALADPLADGIVTIPGGIEDVRIGGTWENEGKSGAYRVLIARSGGDTVTARLFVQWIAYQEDGSATVDNSIEVKELADLKVDIVNYQSESDRDGLSVYIETIGAGADQDSNYELHVLSPTDYKFGPASN